MLDGGGWPGALPPDPVLSALLADIRTMSPYFPLYDRSYISIYNIKYI